jgi:hypothetical protein
MNDELQLTCTLLWVNWGYHPDISETDGGNTNKNISAQPVWGKVGNHSLEVSHKQQTIASNSATVVSINISGSFNYY